MRGEANGTAYVELFEKLERERGFRGNLYRQRCLRRRVAVRMRARGIQSPEAYAALLDHDPAEYERLLRTLTINVSRFFRNPETWDVLRTTVLPELLAEDGNRVFWSAGAAAGEETYTLAILVRRWLTAHDRGAGTAVTIVGTDIDREALATARRGIYSDAALSEVPSGLMQRWFDAADGGGYRLDASIRSMVEFRELDVLGDRPDFDADLVICRNVLIYLDRKAQERVFRTFEDVLRPGGFLVLGRVETLAPASREQFETVDLRERVYRRR